MSDVIELFPNKKDNDKEENVETLLNVNMDKFKDLKKIIVIGLEEDNKLILRSNFKKVSEVNYILDLVKSKIFT